MTKFLPALGAFLLWACFALIVHQYLGNSLLGDCAIVHNETESDPHNEQPSETIPKAVITEEKKASVVDNAFTVKTDDDTSVFSFKKGFEITSLNGSVNIPEELTGLNDSLYAYLNNNQDKELLFTIEHLASEANINGNHLGILRARAIEKFCIDAGINPKKITTEIIESTYDYDTKNNNYNAISLQFHTISNERIAEVESSIANKTLYSNFAVRSFLPDKELVAYTMELKNYLKKYPNKKVYVEGHTDSVGTNNYAFGLGRANNVKDYLISQGISASIIKASSKGEDEPIAANSTEEGRAKNRRIEITIK